MNIEDSIAKGESQLLSFISSYKPGKSRKSWKFRLKKSAELCEEIAESLCGMANSEGGTVLVGVEKDGDVVGVNYSEDKIVNIFDHSEKFLIPRQEVRFAIEESRGKRFLKIEVEKSPVPVKLQDGRYLIRFWKKNYPVTASDLLSLRKGKMKVFHEREFIEEAALSDLDYPLIERLCTRVGWKEDPVKLLHDRYRLIDFKGEKAMVTRAAMLLFATDQQRWNPGGGIDFMKFISHAATVGKRESVAERMRINLPILNLIDASFEKLKMHIKEREKFHDLFMVEKYEYPTSAWQEALLNAIAHRDYSIHGSPIEVRVYEDRLEIRSPGLLPEPYSLSEIAAGERSHLSRNPVIATVLSDCGYIGERGGGIRRIHEDMEDNNLASPEFKEEGFMFCITLKNTPVFDEKTQEWLQRFSSYKLNNRQKRVLAWAYNHGNRFSNRDYQTLGKVDRDIAYREILDMERMKIVAPSAHGKYRISETKP
ncbi:MAG: ATP-binding protein [Acidobacteriota bacterium]